MKRKLNKLGTRKTHNKYETGINKINNWYKWIRKMLNKFYLFTINDSQKMFSIL